VVGGRGAPRATGRLKMACVAPCFHGGTVVRTPCAGLLPSWFRRGPGGGRAIVAQGSLSSPFAALRAGSAAFPPRRDSGGADQERFSDFLVRGAGKERSDYPVCGAAKARTTGKAAPIDRGAATRVRISFSWTPMSARLLRSGGIPPRGTVPSVHIAAEPRRVGQALASSPRGVLWPAE
jgi:hypothetical protein